MVSFLKALAGWRQGISSNYCHAVDALVNEPFDLSFHVLMDNAALRINGQRKDGINALHASIRHFYSPPDISQMA